MAPLLPLSCLPSSEIDAATVFNPTGPPPNFSIMVESTFYIRGIEPKLVNIEQTERFVHAFFVEFLVMHLGIISTTF